jgi:hypothetical protein
MKSVDAFLDYAKDHPDFDISQMTRGKFGEGQLPAPKGAGL